VYAQMAGGSIVDAEIQGGCILVDGLPYPPCMSQPPPVWQDGGGMEAFSMDPDGGEDQEIDFNDIDDKWVFEALETIDLPSPWEHRSEMRAGDKSGRMYFVDPRSRRTTWK
ncbi:unnamed protein product, partial [Polarella glacialis]